VQLITAKVNQHKGKLKDEEPEYNPDRVKSIFRQEAMKRSILRSK